ncbi:MAG TPA: hypothetical protein VFK02_16280 [Kofleriaceae bacterium]|nr:hypothetical protein [Kofleriaceae bacterium]
MRAVTFVLVCVLACPLAVTACGGDGQSDAAPYDTLQDCYDDHHVNENLTVQEAIVVCCLDHPIGGVHPSCGSTAIECVDHVDMELDSSVSPTDIDAACTTYIDER